MLPAHSSGARSRASRPRSRRSRGPRRKPHSSAPPTISTSPGSTPRAGFRPHAIVSGPSGTGKSTLAAEIAGHTGFVHLSSDAVRKELAGLSPGERRKEPFGEGIYSDDFTRGHMTSS
ncbi:MAG: AAA family ATPase [Thermodesulfobacteriota bacterium]|nr:MAG: AAA family ATPase [Thermodesulfobacteriota bacterium]